MGKIDQGQGIHSNSVSADGTPQESHIKNLHQQKYIYIYLNTVDLIEKDAKTHQTGLQVFSILFCWLFKIFGAISSKTFNSQKQSAQTSLFLFSCPNCHWLGTGQHRQGITLWKLEPANVWNFCLIILISGDQLSVDQLTNWLAYYLSSIGVQSVAVKDKPNYQSSVFLTSLKQRRQGGEVISQQMLLFI